MPISYACCVHVRAVHTCCKAEWRGSYIIKKLLSIKFDLPVESSLIISIQFSKPPHLHFTCVLILSVLIPTLLLRLKIPYKTIIRISTFNSYSKTIKMHLFLKLFILVKRSKCFGRSFRPSSGGQNCTYGNRYMSNSCCYLLLAAASSR